MMVRFVFAGASDPARAPGHAVPEHRLRGDMQMKSSLDRTFHTSIESSNRLFHLGRLPPTGAHAGDHYDAPQRPDLPHLKIQLPVAAGTGPEAQGRKVRF